MLLRAIAIQWLKDHTIVPPFAPPPVEVSPQAYAIARDLKGGNERLAAYVPTPSELEVAKIFGIEQPKELPK